MEDEEECEVCGDGDKVPAGTEYWACTKCDSEWFNDEAPPQGALAARGGK